MSRGVPSESIIVETEGESTLESTALAGEIMRRMGLQSAIVVSDGYHIYRVKKMLQFRGLKSLRLAAQGPQSRFAARSLELRKTSGGLCVVARRPGGVTVGVGAGCASLARAVGADAISDTSVYGIVVMTQTAVTLVACYLPARRASVAEPMIALRHE